jgi:hypothetical protein
MKKRRAKRTTTRRRKRVVTKRRKQVARRLNAKTALRARKRRTKRSGARPRTFEEVKTANLADPFHAARIHRAFEMGDRFDDPTANSDDQWEREVSVHRDCEGGVFWQVEWATATAAAMSRSSMVPWPNRGRAITSPR